MSNCTELRRLKSPCVSYNNKFRLSVSLQEKQPGYNFLFPLHESICEDESFTKTGCLSIIVFLVHKEMLKTFDWV